MFTHIPITTQDGSIDHVLVEYSYMIRKMSLLYLDDTENEMVIKKVAKQYQLIYSRDIMEDNNHINIVGLFLKLRWDNETKYEPDMLAKYFSTIQELFINGDCLNFSKALINLKNLIWLSMHQEPKDVQPLIDMNWLPNLQVLRLPTLKNVINLEYSNLIGLSIGDTDNTKPDFSKIKLPHSLEKISIFSPRVTSLHGIEQLTNVKEVELYSMRNLNDISALNTLPQLEILTIKHCNKIDYINFTNNQQLKKIYIRTSEEGTVHLPTIKFVNNLSNLTNFDYYGTVADGDMTPLLAKNIQKIYIKDVKKHSHTSEQILEERRKNRL
jgi:hypothetical protein